MKSFFKISALIFLGLIVVACLETVTNSDSSKEQAILANYTESLIVENYPEIVMFSINSGSDEKSLNIYISPSCNDSKRLTLKIMDAIKSNDPIFNKTNVTFTFMPRNEKDFKTIAGFMCIETKHKARAVIEYYRNTEGTFINHEIVTPYYHDILRKYGVTDRKRVQCENDKLSQQKIGVMYLAIDSLRKRDQSPVVMYNDTYVDIIKFDKLRKHMAR